LEARRKIGDKKGAEQDEFKVIEGSDRQADRCDEKDVAQNMIRRKMRKAERRRKKSEKNKNRQS
jgi:hypothetical protein